MSVLNELLSFVDAFAASSKSLQASLCWIFMSLLLQIISLSTHNWVNLNSQTYETQGLWTHCKEEGENTCCQSVERYIFSLQTNVPGWIHATRALQILAFITAICSAVITTFYIGVESQPMKSVLFKASIIVNEVTGLLILLSVIIYGSRYRYELWLNNGFLSASFGVSTTTGVSFVIIGILIAGSSGSFQIHANQTSAVNNTDIQQQNHTDTQGVVPSIRPRQTFNTTVTPSAPPAPPTPPAEERTLPGRVDTEDNQCVICMDEAIQTVFLPCGHSICCRQCANVIQRGTRQCPICRRRIASWNRIYR